MVAVWERKRGIWQGVVEKGRTMGKKEKIFEGAIDLGDLEKLGWKYELFVIPL